MLLPAIRFFETAIFFGLSFAGRRPLLKLDCAFLVNVIFIISRYFRQGKLKRRTTIHHTGNTVSTQSHIFAQESEVK